jgi:hypothetical protein
MNGSDKAKNLVRRILVAVALMIALVLEPFSILGLTLLRSDGAPFGSPADGHSGSNYFPLTALGLLAGVIVFVDCRSRWRWLLLLLFVPCAACFVFALISHRR